MSVGEAVLDRPPAPKPTVETPPSALPHQKPDDTPLVTELPSSLEDLAKDAPPAEGPNAAAPDQSSQTQTETQESPTTSPSDEKDHRPLEEQVREVGELVMVDKIKTIVDTIRSLPADEAVARLKSHEGELALLTIRDLRNNPTTFKGTLQVTTATETTTITKIESFTDDTFRCKVEGSEDLKDIARVDAENAVLLHKADRILAEFPEDSPRRAAFELRIKFLLQGENAFSDNASVEQVLGAAKDSLASGQKEAAVLSPEEKMMEVLDSALKIFNMSAETGVVLVNDARTQEHVHALLRIANKADGEAGIIFRVHALTVLEQLKQIGQLKQLKLGEVGLAAKLANQAAAAKEKLLTKLNLTPEERVALLNAGDNHEMLVGLIEKKMLGNEKGVSELIFGKNMSKKELFALLGQEKEEMAGGLLAMIIAYLFEELLIKPLTQKLY